MSFSSESRDGHTETMTEYVHPSGAHESTSNLSSSDGSRSSQRDIDIIAREISPRQDDRQSMVTKTHNETSMRLPPFPSHRKELRIYTQDVASQAVPEEVIFATASGMPIFASQPYGYDSKSTSPSHQVSPLPNHMALHHPASQLPQEAGLYADQESVFHVSGSHVAPSSLMPRPIRSRPGMKRAESMIEPRVMGNPEHSPLMGHSGMSMSGNMQSGMSIMRPESTPVGPSQGYHTAYFIQHPSSGPNGQVMSYQLADGQQIFMAQSPFVQTGVQVHSMMPDSNQLYDANGNSPMLHSAMPSQYITHPQGGFMMNRSHSDPFAMNFHGMAPDTVAMESIVGQTAYATPMNKGMYPNGFAGSPLESTADGESTIASTAKKPRSMAMWASQPPYSARSLTPMSAYSNTDSSYQPSASGRYRSTLINGEEGPDDEMDDDEDGGIRRGSSIARLAHNQGSPTRPSKGRLTRPGQLRRANTMMEQSTSAAASISSRRKAKGQASADALEDMKSRDAGRKPPHGLGTKSSAAAKNKEYVPENIPIGPRSNEKPPWSYAALIGQAILASSRKRLALSQIYSWISTAYPYFKPGDAGWMNSIRHNLSLNDCFVKGERGEEDAGGKGSVWMIDPVAEFQFKDGGFKKASKAKAEAAAAAAGEVKKAGASTSRKRKAADPEPATLNLLGPPLQPQPLLQPLMMPIHIDTNYQPMSYAPMPLHVVNSPVLQASPIPNELELSKRLRFEDGETSAGSDMPSRPATSQSLRQDSLSSAPPDAESATEGNDSMIADGVSPLRHANGEGSRSSMLSPEALQSQRKPSIIHRSALDKTSSRSQLPSNIADDTFNTPNRPLSVEVQYSQPSSGIFGMLPHLTPSASSPISSSPAPSTITKVGLMDRRMAQLSDLRRPDAVRIRTVKDEYSSDSGFVEPMKQPHSVTGLDPPAHLELDTTFIAPALPITIKRNFDHLEAAKHSERQQITLSPMHKAHRRVKSVTLPGPSELLSNSPKAGDHPGSSTDPLNQLDRLPKSPIGRPKSPMDSFATPVAPNGRARISNFTPRTLSGITATPMRTSTLGNLLHHQTPAGLMKAQFKAEHGLLDSPMGLSGSCYDMSDAGYRVDRELEHLQTNGLQSPTTSYGHQRYQSVVFGYDQSP